MKAFADKKTLSLLVMLCVTAALGAFRPDNSHFATEYQYKLFLSWLQRSDFPPEAPANLSHNSIGITFKNLYTQEEAKTHFLMQEGRITKQLEKINGVQTDLEQIEENYRYYLEQLLYRINSSHTFFITDFTEQMNLELAVGKITDNDSIAVYLQSGKTGNRINAELITFSSLNDDSFIYNIEIKEDLFLRVIFDGRYKYEQLSQSLRSAERSSENIAIVQQPQSQQRHSFQKHPQRPIVPSVALDPETHLPLSPSITDTMKLRDFIHNYKDNRWRRDILHNKISNHEIFLSEEFPAHNLNKNPNSFKLETDMFQYHMSGDLILDVKKLRDGMAFTSSEDYHLDENNKLTIATGEEISLSDLTKEEIETIAPFMNQLVTMHRVLGTKLLNFLLIPADVPAFLVLRDPEREVIELESYTDLILMLSRYWENRNIYFNIDSVKKINDYIEIGTSLVAHKNEKDYFDFAEILFSLNRQQRIDVAMVVIHTEVEMD